MVAVVDALCVLQTSGNCSFEESEVVSWPLRWLFVSLISSMSIEYYGVAIGLQMHS